jgi:hypothetical protein
MLSPYSPRVGSRVSDRRLAFKLRVTYECRALQEDGLAGPSEDKVYE